MVLKLSSTGSLLRLSRSAGETLQLCQVLGISSTLLMPHLMASNTKVILKNGIMAVLVVSTLTK